MSETEHTYQVTVSGCTVEQADRVIAERISYDEDYGFEYRIDYAHERRDRTPQLVEETTTCRHCGHGIGYDAEEGWVAPDAGFDVEDGDGIWRVTCPDNHQDRIAAHEPVETCDRHDGVWGDDVTCERCTYEDGTPRPLTDKGPLGPGAEGN